MTVSELIEFLKTQPHDLQVAHRMYSEYVLLDQAEVVVEELGVARPDGWVPSKRSNAPSQGYLLFPGN